MADTKKTNWRKILVVNLVLIAVVCISTARYIAAETKDVTTTLKTNILEQEKKLITLAEITARAQPDAATAKLIRDCEVRDEYEALLNKLNLLSKTELNTVKQLFEQCADYYPVTKGVMVSKLKQEYEAYENYIDVLQKINPEASRPFPVDAWRSLIAKEAARSELLTQQKEIQGDIIVNLLVDNRQQINILLEEARGISDSLDVISIQIKAERSKLVEV